MSKDGFDKNWSSKPTVLILKKNAETALTSYENADAKWSELVRAAFCIPVSFKETKAA